ncbi:hypothetical protein GCM10023142_23960 [Anaerocolumna aminovalerica]|uniref:DUF6774 domain-containing protein n=1 Tax=Anaerocolumna aminovalerica TaxID=1527 RepID=A0A1I5J7R1_9FIRM|nr:DUF6774 domain-containing protein [Anaerocolumna aminovalerica]SFO68719.1 hypothetical protein SAMN04489757_1715 [Anaerocolumna aminovalerica]
MEVNSFSPEELVIFVSAVSIAIAKDKSNEELDVLSSVFSQIGDSLGTFLAQRERIEAANKNDNDDNDNDNDCTDNKVE